MDNQNTASDVSSHRGKGYGYHLYLGNDGFWTAEINTEAFGVIQSKARDQLRAIGFAYRSLGERMIEKSKVQPGCSIE